MSRRRPKSTAGRNKFGMATRICNHCIHNQPSLRQQCAKLRGGLYRLQVATLLDCNDFTKIAVMAAKPNVEG